MTDAEIMEKYGLSFKRLKKLFRKLLEARVITHSELYEKSAVYRKTVDSAQARRHPRIDLAVPLHILDVESSCSGLIRDISEGGLRVAGIKARVGEQKTFEIPVDVFTGFEPVSFGAECVWVKTRGKAREYTVAGFIITSISDNDRRVLKKFIRFLVLSKSGEWEALE